MLARLITMPRTIELGASRVIPTELEVPSISIRPSGWVVPSRVIVPVIVGRLLNGLRVWAPAPKAEKLIVSAPAAALAALIASRRLQCVPSQVPSLASLVELTVKTAAGDEGTKPDRLRPATGEDD